jgi:hypothetical protein
MKVAAMPPATRTVQQGMISYQDAVTTLAETDDLDMTDAELAAQELFTGEMHGKCGLPLAIADVEGVTCCCDPPV